MMAKKKFRSKEEGELFRDNTYCSRVCGVVICVCVFSTQ